MSSAQVSSPLSATTPNSHRLIVLPFAFPKGLCETLQAEVRALDSRIRNTIPSPVRESISSMYLRVRIDVDVNVVGQLRGVRASLGNEFASRSMDGFSVEEEMDLTEIDDAPEQVLESVETAWIERSVARRMEWGRELYHVPHEALAEHILAGLRRSEEDSLAFEGYPLFLHHLAVAELSARQDRLGGHEMVVEARKAAVLAAHLSNELESARHWWSSEAPKDLKGRETAVSSNCLGEERLLLLYRDWHFQRDGCWPLFNLWGEPLERDVVAQAYVSTEG